MELVYLVTALVPSDTACLASSPGSRSLTAVWISLEVMVDLLLLPQQAPIRLETITNRQTSGFGGGGFGMATCGRVPKMNWGGGDEVPKCGVGLSRSKVAREPVLAVLYRPTSGRSPRTVPYRTGEQSGVARRAVPYRTDRTTSGRSPLKVPTRPAPHAADGGWGLLPRIEKENVGGGRGGGGLAGVH